MIRRLAHWPWHNPDTRERRSMVLVCSLQTAVTSQWKVAWSKQNSKVNRVRSDTARKLARSCPGRILLAPILCLPCASWQSTLRNLCSAIGMLYSVVFNTWLTRRTLAFALEDRLLKAVHIYTKILIGLVPRRLGNRWVDTLLWWVVLQLLGLLVRRKWLPFSQQNPSILLRALGWRRLLGTDD